MRHRPSTLEQVSHLCEAMLQNLPAEGDHAAGKREAYTMIAQYIRSGLTERELGEGCANRQTPGSGEKSK